jgi:trans-aconitate 2-methyltransferase
MAWDPKTYLNFGDHRTRPAAELLARIDVNAPGRAVDLGCGPGNSTALLAARWPEAQITAIDNSREMLEAARGSGVRATWCEADVGTWTPDVPQDVVFSNATLQWIPNHHTLLPRLMNCVAPGGVFAMQVPRNFGEPAHQRILEVARGKSWAHKFEGVRNWHHVQSPEAYFGLLEPHAASIDIWETQYCQVLEGEDAVLGWMRGTGLRPFLAVLDEGERAEFLEDYRAALARAYPRRASGVTLFPFLRLFVVARGHGQRSG